MTDIKRAESLIQSAYGAEGYHVSRVTGKALIVTLPASGQNFDELIVELRSIGCSVHFETLADESPPRVELYVQPGAHADVTANDVESERDISSLENEVRVRPSRKHSSDASMLPKANSKPEGCFSWKCVCITLLVILAAFFVLVNSMRFKDPGQE